MRKHLHEILSKVCLMRRHQTRKSKSIRKEKCPDRTQKSLPDGKTSGWDGVRMGWCPDGRRLKRKSGGVAVRAEISEADV